MTCFRLALYFLCFGFGFPSLRPLGFHDDDISSTCNKLVDDLSHRRLHHSLSGQMCASDSLGTRIFTKPSLDIESVGFHCSSLELSLPMTGSLHAEATIFNPFSINGWSFTSSTTPFSQQQHLSFHSARGTLSIFLFYGMAWQQVGRM